MLAIGGPVGFTATDESRVNADAGGAALGPHVTLSFYTGEVLTQPGHFAGYQRVAVDDTFSSGGWVTMNVQAVAPAGATRARAGVHIDAALGTFWFDDVRLEQVIETDD